ncbi:MAG: hypothetical protein AABX16_01565 [Nanoarchaeota archaeon]
MNPKKSNVLIVAIILSITIIVCMGYLYFFIYLPSTNPPQETITDFESCAAVGYPVMESYPRQCRTANGKIFVEDVQDTNNKEIYCALEQRETDFCTQIYEPVCGWLDPAKIQCIKYPCAQTFSNSCVACGNENVLYFTDGECPK